MDAVTAEKVYETVEFEERMLLGLLVTATGGCMDAYSYLTQGRVFATGQTGNCVLFALHVAELDLVGAIHYLTPILSFVVGIFLSRLVLDLVHRRNHFRTQRFTLWFEALAFALIALAPEEAPDLLVNSCISFVAAMLFVNFRKFGKGSAYASVFCTGNLRAFTENLYDGLVRGSVAARGRALRYLSIILVFLLGAVTMSFAVSLQGSRAAWIVSVLAIVASFFITDMRHEVEMTKRAVLAAEHLERRDR